MADSRPNPAGRRCGGDDLASSDRTLKIDKYKFMAGLRQLITVNRAREMNALSAVLGRELKPACVQGF